jgi:hypothetical protein
VPEIFVIIRLPKSFKHLITHKCGCQTHCMGDSKFHIPGQHKLMGAVTKEQIMRAGDDKPCHRTTC